MRYISNCDYFFHLAIRTKNIGYLSDLDSLNYPFNSEIRMIEDDLTPFVYCIRLNDPDYNYYLKKLLPDLAKTTKFNFAYLHEAVGHHNVFAVDLLIKNGIDVDARDHNGCTALHVASHLGYNDIVPKLISSGANIEIENFNKNLPIHEAVISSNFPTILLLLKAKSNYVHKNIFGLTPLDLASKNQELMNLITLYANLNTDQKLIAQIEKLKYDPSPEQEDQMHVNGFIKEYWYDSE